MGDHLSPWEWSSRCFWVRWRGWWVGTPNVCFYKGTTTTFIIWKINIYIYISKKTCPENITRKNPPQQRRHMTVVHARLVEVQLIPTSSSTTSCNSSLNPLPARSPRCLTRSLTAIGRLWRGWLGQVTLEPAWSFQMHYYALIPMKLWFLWGVMFHRWVITAPGRIFQKMIGFLKIRSPLWWAWMFEGRHKKTPGESEASQMCITM